MNSVWILILTAVWFYFGYKVYGRFIEKKLKIDDKNKTPASLKKEGVDFSASKKPFLVGISMLMFILGAYVAKEGFSVLRKNKNKL